MTERVTFPGERPRGRHPVITIGDWRRGSA